MTQWLFGTKQCACLVQSDEKAESSLVQSLCWTCGKPVAPSKRGTITQWVFRGDQCQCANPNTSRAAKSGRLREERRAASDDAAYAETRREPVIETFVERYDIVALLGTGASGSVYRAFDRTLQKEVAIKRLSKQKLTPRHVTSLQQEARAASKLQHKNLVTVLDFGASAEEPYLVMEYAPGNTLSGILQERGALPINTALGITLQLCDGLGHAHEKGIIHCDLNSRNIIITGNDSDWLQVKILDFGIAKFAQEASLEPINQQNTLACSPLYASPEQCKNQPLDGRTDVYAVGCLLYEMLTGSPPYVGATTQETLMMHTNAPLPKLGVIDHAFAPELEQLVLHAISKRKEDRFASMQEFAAAIEDVLRPYDLEKTVDRVPALEAPALSLPLIPMNSAARPRRSHLILLGCAALLVLAGATTAIWNGQHEAPQKQSARKKKKAKPYQPMKYDSELTSQPLVSNLTGRMYVDIGRHIWFNDPELNDDDVQAIKRLAESSPIIDSIYMDDTRGVTPERLEQLSLQQIKKISVRKSDVSDEGILTISKFPGLRRLDISDCNLSDRSCDFLAQNATELDNLNITSLPISEAGFSRLAALTKLRTLSASGNSWLGDRSTLIIAGLKDVDVLYLDRTAISDRAMSSLAGMQALKFLSISGNKISDSGLLELLKKKNWKGLGLANTGITSRSMDGILSLKGLQALSIDEKLIARAPRISRLNHLYKLYLHVSSKLEIPSRLPDCDTTVVANMDSRSCISQYLAELGSRESALVPDPTGWAKPQSKR